MTDITITSAWLNSLNRAEFAEFHQFCIDQQDYQNLRKITQFYVIKNRENNSESWSKTNFR